MKINMTRPKGAIPYSQSKETTEDAKKLAKKFAEKNKEAIEQCRRIAKSQQPWMETIKKLKLSQLKSSELPLDIHPIDKNIFRNITVETLKYGIERQEKQNRKLNKQNKEANYIAYIAISVAIMIGVLSLASNILLTFILRGA